MLPLTTVAGAVARVAGGLLHDRVRQLIEGDRIPGDVYIAGSLAGPTSVAHLRTPRASRATPAPWSSGAASNAPSSASATSTGTRSSKPATQAAPATSTPWPSVWRSPGAPSVAASVAARNRKPAEDMSLIVEDLIKLLDEVSNSMRRGRYPEKVEARKEGGMDAVRAEQADPG